MVKTKNNRKIEILFLCLVLAIILLNFVYWGNKKSGFHIDEVFSFHFISQFDSQTILDGRDGEPYYNNVHTSDFFKDFVTINEKEAFRYSSAIEGANRSCHPPVFYLIFFTIQSIFKNFSKWPGIILNIVVFVAGYFLLYKLSGLFTDSFLIRILTCLIYGINLSTVSNVVFLRMYIMLSVETIWYLWIVCNGWEKTDEKNMGKRVKWYLLIFVTIVLGTLTHYFFCVFAFFFCGLSCLYLLLKKKIRVAIEYGTAQLAAVLSCFIVWPNMLSDLTGKRGTATTTQLLSSDGSYGSRFADYIRIISAHIFGGNIPLLIGTIVILTVMAVFIGKKKNQTSIILGIKNEKYHLLYILGGACVFYVAFVSKSAEYKSVRYLMPVCSCIILLSTLTVGNLTKYIEDKVWMKILYALFVIIISCSGYKNVKVANLFEEDKAGFEMMENINHKSIVYLFKDCNDEGNRQCATLDGLLFENAENVLIIDYDHVDLIKAYMGSEKEFVLFITETFSEDEMNKAKSVILNYTGMTTSTELCKTRKSTAFLVK